MDADEAKRRIEEIRGLSDEEQRQLRDEAPRRLSDPDGPAQQELRRLKERDWSENTLPASAVFAQRLREMRKVRRGMNLAQLAHRMEAKGHPLSETALRRIERCERGLSLDEAFALIEALDAVPVYMLSPPDDMLIRLSESVATDGEGLRSWFVSGLPERTVPERRQPPPPEIADAVEHEQRARTNIARMARLAQALVDAKDDAERQPRAWTALVNEAIRQDHERAKEADPIT